MNALTVKLLGDNLSDDFCSSKRDDVFTAHILGTHIAQAVLLNENKLKNKEKHMGKKTETAKTVLKTIVKVATVVVAVATAVSQAKNSSGNWK